MNAAEFDAKSLPEKLRAAAANEGLWEVESDAIERAADVLESAPHGDDCTYLEEDVVEPYGTRISPNAHCTCWKSGL